MNPVHRYPNEATGGRVSGPSIASYGSSSWDALFARKGEFGLLDNKRIWANLDLLCYLLNMINKSIAKIHLDVIRAW